MVLVVQALWRNWDLGGVMAVIEQSIMGVASLPFPSSSSSYHIAHPHHTPPYSHRQLLLLFLLAWAPFISLPSHLRGCPPRSRRSRRRLSRGTG